MREIHISQITTAVRDLCIKANTHLGEDVLQAFAQAIDQEVRGLVDKAHDDALLILRQNMALLETIAQKILEKEVIEGDDLKQMLEASVLPEGVSA